MDLQKPFFGVQKKLNVPKICFGRQKQIEAFKKKLDVQNIVLGVQNTMDVQQIVLGVQEHFWTDTSMILTCKAFKNAMLHQDYIRSGGTDVRRKRFRL